MTESDFLRAICSNPADDLPRLMYADWLEENAGDAECPRCNGYGYLTAQTFQPTTQGFTCAHCSGSGRVSDGRRERSEFIRVQCELAGRPFPDTRCVKCGRNAWDKPNQKYCGNGGDKDNGHCYQRTKEGEALRQRERELWDAYKFDWFGGDRWAILCLEHERGGELEDLSYAFVTRGFVSEVRAPLAVLIGDYSGEISNAGGHLSFTPGIAGRLIGVQPVGRWVDPSRKPLGRMRSGGLNNGQCYEEFAWLFEMHAMPAGEFSHVLPNQVWDKLEGGYRWAGDFRVYDSEASALLALSRAIATIARQQSAKAKPSPAPAVHPRTFQPLLA